MSQTTIRVLIIIGLALVLGVLVKTRKAWISAIGHAIPSIWRIAKITVAEARRRRVVQAVVALVVLILFSMTFFSYLSPAEQAKMLISGGLSAITVFGILLAIFVGAFLIPHEIETRTIYAILAKPVRRVEFVLGKYLGALIIIGVIVAIMTAVLVIVLVIQDHIVKDMPDSVFDPNLRNVVMAALMSYCALAVLTALIILISTVSSTTMTVIAAFIIWAIGSMQSQLHDLAESNTGGERLLLLVIYTVVPKLENFDFTQVVSNFLSVHPVEALLAVLYGIGYSSVALVLATIFFNDRQV